MFFDGKDKKVNVTFRVDSSTQIGSGHLMRCLTLAGQMKKEKQPNIIFISRDLDGNLNYLIEQNGYQLFLLPRVKVHEELNGYEKWLTVKLLFDAEQTRKILQKLDADCLIVDSYAIDDTWENIVRQYVKKIMVIDDLANRKHNCDILLDQNYYLDMQNRYNALIPKECKLLLGPQYALLREEFYQTRKKMRIRDGNIKNIFVFFGGSDLTNETMKALQAIELLNRKDILVNVVVGGSNQNKDEVEDFCQQHDNMHYYYQVNNMAELMNEADLAIGAGGATTWERCFLGLPTIVVAIAENQIKISEDCASYGCINYIGNSESVNSELIKKSIVEYFENRQMLKILSVNGIKLLGKSNFSNLIINVF